jgi:hypothetical protein
MRTSVRHGLAALLLAAGPAIGQPPPAAPDGVISSYRPIPQPAAQPAAPRIELVAEGNGAKQPPAPRIELTDPAVGPAGGVAAPASSVRMSQEALLPGVRGASAPQSYPGAWGAPAPQSCEGPAAHAGPGQESFGKRCLRRLQECFLGVPEVFQDPPLGTSLYANFKTQVDNGEAARMTLYRYDFLDGTNALNPRGRERLAQIAALLPRNFAPVVIEPAEGPPALSEARRLEVLNALGQGPFPIPPERVVVARPAAIGLSGTEAGIIYLNQLQQTLRQGITVGAGAGGQGGPQGPGGLGGGPGGGAILPGAAPSGGQPPIQ